MENKKYTIVHCHTMYSNNILTDSTSSPRDYVEKAKELGVNLIFTEHGAACAWTNKKNLLESNEMKYVHATEGYVRNNPEDKENYHILVYGLNDAGRKEVNKLISLAYKEDHFYKRPTFFIDELLQCKNVAISTACLGGLFKKQNQDSEIFKKLFDWGINNKEKFFIEIQPHNCEEQIEHNKFLIELHNQYGFQLIASNDVHYHSDEAGELRADKQKAQKMKFTSEDSFNLKMLSYNEMYEAFKSIGTPENIINTALENTNKLYDMVEPFELDKSFKMPSIYENAEDKVLEIIYKELESRNISQEEKEAQKLKIHEEISVMKKLNSISYMYMIYSWLKGLREKGIEVGYGRGSVTGSAVANLLNISQINPIYFKTLFFRFLNPEKISLPDIDVDIASDRRQEAKEYFYSVEGLNCAEIITFQKDLENGAIRSMGRTLGMPIEEVEKIISNISQYREDEDYADFFEKVDELDGFVKATSIHAAGMVVSSLNIEEEIGILSSFDKKLNKRRYFTQIDMRELDALGYVKVDALGLSSIGAINLTCKYLGIKRPTPEELNLEDENVWNHIQNSSSGITIFQFEKEKAFNYLKSAVKNIKNMKKFDIMTATSGIIRPCGDSIRDNFFNGDINDTGSEIVNKMFEYNNNFVIYQEDIMNFLTTFAGYSNAEADYVRKAISKKGGTDKIIEEFTKRFKTYFLQHYNETEENAEKVLNHMNTIMKDAENYGLN